LWWTADPPRPFQLRPVPICSALRFLVAGLPPAFISRRISRLSQGIAFSYRVTLMVRPLLLAEPGPGDASCTTWTLSVSFRPRCFQAGRPSNRFAIRSFPVLRPSPCASSLVAFYVCFESRDLPHSCLALQLSSCVSSLTTFFTRFRPVRLSPCVSSLAAFLTRIRSCDLLRSLQVFRPSPFLLRSQPFG